MNRRLFIDVSQFIGYPVATGVQRTLLFLAEYWPAESVTAEVGFREGGHSHYMVVPLPAFRDALKWVFTSKHDAEPGVTSQQLIERLSVNSTISMTPDQLSEAYDGYLLPEPTFREDILDTVDLCSARMGNSCFAIIYDALQQTHPQFFPGSSMSLLDRYFLSVGNLASLAFISKRTRRIFENRFRVTVSNALDIPLGVDALGLESNPVPDLPKFVVIGTVEQRKRPDLVLKAFERLWRDGREYKLCMLGLEGSDKDYTGYFRRSAEKLDNFTWDDSVTDEDLAAAVRSASGMIFISELEGYGLPAVEALALGCPVIVSANLPAIETLPDAGQLRMTTVSEETIAAAVEQLADPTTNAGMREAITHLDLPIWSKVVTDFASWVECILDEGSCDRTG